MKTINDMDKALRILIKLLTGFYCQHGCCYATSSNQKEEKCTASSTLTLSTYGSLISLIQAPLHVWNHSRGLLSDHGSDSFSISGLWMAVKYFYCHASTWTRQTQHRKKSGGEHSRNIMSTTKKKCVKVSRDRLEADVRDGIFWFNVFCQQLLVVYVISCKYFTTNISKWLPSVRKHLVPDWTEVHQTVEQRAFPLFSSSSSFFHLHNLILMAWFGRIGKTIEIIMKLHSQIGNNTFLLHFINYCWAKWLV